MYKILLVSPFYGGSLPISHYCKEAFQDIGCLVDFFDSTQYYASVEALDTAKISVQKAAQLRSSFVHFVSQVILARVEAFQPDMVFCLAQAPLSILALETLKKKQILSAMWFVEDYERFPYWRTFAPLYDIFIRIQKEPFATLLKDIGQPHSLYLPLAALPSIHHPLAKEELEQEFHAKVSFLGAGYPNRLMAFNRFIHFDDFKLWGNGWEKNEKLIPFLQRNGERISSEDSVKIFAASQINLNLHSSSEYIESAEMGDFINPRTFELAACGAFQIVDNRTLLHEFFTEDELAISHSWRDMEEKTRYFLKHPDQRAVMAEKARMRVLKEHTYQKRLNHFLEYVEEHFPCMKEKKEKRSINTIHPKIRKELTDLLASYKVDSSISLEELATMVEQKEEALNEAELALLFLAQWKKLHLQ